MTNANRTACSLALAAAMALGAGSAQAALVNFTLTGTVNYSDEDPNAVFGLNNGDEISAVGVFDDAGLSGAGLESVSFGSGTGNSITLYVGNSTYTQVDDYNYGLGTYPQLAFNDGAFAGLNFETDLSADTAFQSLDTYFYGYDYRLDFSTVISGTWAYETAAVPVPAAVWLLGSGLLGLAGVARRRTAL